MLSASEIEPAPQTGTDACQFMFRGAGGAIAGQGGCVPVAVGQTDTLALRIHQAFARAPKDSVVGGALPFDKRRDDHLWMAPSTNLPRGSDDEHSTEQVPLQVRPDPPASEFAEAVADAVRIMDAEQGAGDALRKIVLARTLAIESTVPFRTGAILDRLSRDPSVTAYQVALPARAGDTGQRVLVGATPELLLGKVGKRVTSHPLAGSARRHADPVADSDAAGQLARSEKDRREHAIVVEYILDTLSPHCQTLGCPEGTRLTSTRSMWHLGTPIEGVLKDNTIPSVVLAAQLHPTPAVCGLPHGRAAGLIDQLEPIDRGFYAGAVGWCNWYGDGAWYVAIRCADICDRHARLFAGAGIVPGSDPVSETSETGAKFGALLSALGLPAEAGMQGLLQG